MTTGWKIALSIFAVCGLCLLTSVIGVFYWIKNNGKQLIVEQMQKAKKDVNAGQQFGVKTDQNGCLKQALTQMDKSTSTDFGEQMKNRFFLRGCLESSTPSLGFCNGVPAVNEIMASARWRIQKCQQLEPKHQQCANVIAGIQDFCARPKEMVSSEKAKE
jgi:hypothetical protein